jgi:predicted AlkP superfamily phosphohydrolase/phosphomutase
VFDAAFSNIIGRIDGKLPDPRSGNHKPQGFAIFHGPGIKKQRASEGRILDIAPTILNYFGLKAPDDFDGRPLAVVSSQSAQRG